jgi:invasion protein IalB
MRYIAVLLFCFASTAPAFAQTTPPATTNQVRVAVSGWHLECDPAKTKLSCHALDQIVQQPSGAPVIQFNFAVTPDGKTLLTMQVPLGDAIGAPIDVTIGSTSQKFPFLFCSQQGCYATGTVQPDLLAAMRTSSSDMKVTYSVLDNNLAEHAVTASLSLTGFAQVDDSLK